MKNKMILSAGALLLTACTGPIQDFTVISTNNIDPGKSIADGKLIKNVKGKDTAHIVIVFPTGTSHPQEAVRDALKSAAADMLVNAKMYSYGWYVPYIYGQQKWIVEGDAVVFEE